MDPEEEFVDDESQLDEELHDEDLEDFDEPDDPQDDPVDQDDPESRRPEPQQRKPRAQERITRLDSERKAEKERADRLEAELNAIRRGPTKTADQLATEREARLANMSEAQRLEFLINESKAETRSAIQHIQFATFDASDKATFDGLCERNPAAARLKDEVERQLTEMRASGSNAPRKTVLAYLIGEKALSAQPKARARGQRIAQEGRERQGARSVNGRGDAAPAGNRRLSERDARKARLENMKL